MRTIDLGRLEEAMEDARMDQSALARAVGCTPGAINQILLGNTKRSRFLPDIARALDVDLRWLQGDAVNKTTGKPVRAPAPVVPSAAEIFLKVTLPPEEALAQMFEALLSGVDRKAPLSEQARLLAKRLPIGLSQLQELRPAPIRARALVREQA